MQTRRDVCVVLELGHRAWPRGGDTPGGDTHGDTHGWEVYVRGRDADDVRHFVEKVVFRLQERFPEPRRVCKEPPYQAEGAACGGFLLPIEVHFKNKQTPKKLCFTYDVLVPGEGEPPVDHQRSERITFYNPSKEFRRKLLRGGGVSVEPEPDGVDRGEGPSQAPAPQTATKMQRDKV